MVVFARAVGSLIGSRLLARTGMDRGLQYAIGRMVYYALLVLGLMIALTSIAVDSSRRHTRVATPEFVVSTLALSALNCTL